MGKWLSLAALAGLQFSVWANELPNVTNNEDVEVQTLPATEVFEEVNQKELDYQAWALEIWNSLDRKTGRVQIEGSPAILNVPEQFYFLAAKDAQTVLVDVWGNPPTSSVLGLLIPEEFTPFDDDSWAVTIEYEQDGYVTDEDADKIDYELMLKQMQEDTLAGNAQRVEQGYPQIQLVGWAASPFYDAESNKLHWAKELAFEGYDSNTLNYNIRVLGRRGVLIMNFIAGMEQLPDIQRNLDTVLALAEFERGEAYSDFDPEIDEVAAYGVGALVAGKVLAKTGFIAIVIAFLKKFGVFIVIALGAFAKSLWGKRKAKATESGQ